MKRRWLTAALALGVLTGTDIGSGSPQSDSAESDWTESGPQRVSVLELFTSEGCSSCPSAEAWLARLRAHPGLWKRVVPLNFHVDYWDRLGWPDKFADATHTRRQYRHVEKLGLGSAYTPGFVLEGREWRGFFSPRKQTPEFAPGPETGSLRLRESGDAVEVEFRPAGEVEGPFVVYASVLGFDMANDIRAGENRGRKLVQNFVVLGVSRAETEAKSGLLRVELEAPVRAADRPPEHAVVAWVERAGDPTPIQAVGYGVPRAP